MRRLTTVLTAVGALLWAIACTSAWRTTEGGWVLGKALSANPKILLLPVAGRDSEACEAMTAALLAALSKKDYRVTVSSGRAKQSGAAAIEQGIGQGYDYVLEGVLSKWEDKPSGDEAELTLKLYEVKSGEVVAAATHFDRGRANHWPSDPADFIPELADCTLSRIFGWTPKVYEGDPK